MHSRSFKNILMDAIPQKAHLPGRPLVQPIAFIPERNFMPHGPKRWPEPFFLLFLYELCIFCI